MLKQCLGFPASNVDIKLMTLPPLLEYSVQHLSQCLWNIQEVRSEFFNFKTLRSKESEHQLSPEEKRAQGRTARQLNQLWERLQFQDGILQWQYEGDSAKRKWIHTVCFVPYTTTRSYAGDPLRNNQWMLYQLKEQFYWPSMAEDVRCWCQTYPVCAKKKPHHQVTEPRSMQTV